MTTRIEPTSVAPAVEHPVPAFLPFGEGADLRRIAHLTEPRGETVLLWLGGYGSDMRGSKAEHLATLASELDLTFCRFDYSGHGESSGAFADGTITRWTDEAEAVTAMLGGRRLVVAGSSMGAWIALRLVQRLRQTGAVPRLVGLLLLAPAPDFTQRLVEPHLSAVQRRDLAEQGFCTEPSAYGPDPVIYTRRLIEDGRDNLVMDGLIQTGCSIRIIQGMMDDSVPFSHALDLVAALPAEGVVLTLVRDGDHRLSRPEDLKRMDDAVRDLVQTP